MENDENIELTIPQEEPEKFYVDISEDNRLNGFYSNKVHSEIPETAVEVENTVRKEILASGKQYRIKDKTLPVTTENLEEIIPEPLPPTAFEKLQADVDFLMIMEGYADV